MAECSHDCSSCGADCPSRTALQKEPQNALSDVKRVIAVISGKGGVGKSTVTATLAATARRMGYKVGVLDADITGPSIPKMFGVHRIADAMDENTILPVESRSGIKLMSINLLLEDETEPVIWRGPILAGTLKQFWTNVAWGDVDYLFVDMPPGTGDVVLTAFQSIPIDGLVVVTSPQELVGMIVAKATKMAEMMNIPILGIVENLSYFVCPDCGKKHYIFGKSDVSAYAAKAGIEVVAELPVDPEIARLADEGMMEKAFNEDLFRIVE